MSFYTKIHSTGLNFVQFNSLVYTLFVLTIVSSFNTRTLLGEQCKDCVVTTASGTVFHGVRNQSVLEPTVKFCSYLGIRYGEARRFGKPVLVASQGKRVYNATSDGHKCLQFENMQLVGNEDCLFLNVFTPNRRKTCHSELRTVLKLKPVLIYIHGGAFFEGSSSSGEISPDYLIEHDVILVTLNYRLHVFGFLNLGIPECSGNMGLRDQTTALMWVKRNIEYFGGDPNRVTVMGQSAGAISVHLLKLSPLSRDLLHQVITHSAISSVLAKNNTKSYSIEYAQHIGYDGDLENSHKILEFLKAKDYITLVSGFLTFLLKLAETDVNFYASSQPFWPSVDSSYDEKPFLPKSLEELAKEVCNKSIPAISGQTTLDGTIAFYGSKVETILTYVQEHLDLYLKIYADDKRSDERTIEKIKQYYFHGSHSGNNLTNTIKLLQDFGFYKFYEQNFYRSRKVYNYQFAYDGKTFQYYKQKYLGEDHTSMAKGVSHTEDLNYLFYSRNFFPNLTLTPEDRKIIQEMTTFWTNFVKTGDPNTGDDKKWKPTTPEQKYHLRIDKVSHLYNAEINEERRKFLKSLPPRNHS